MDTKGLTSVFETLLSRNQAFVFFRLPHSKTVHCFYQEDQNLTHTADLKVSGFVMSRFEDPLPAAYISNRNHLQWEFIPPVVESPQKAKTLPKEDPSTYINIVNKTKKAINHGALKKLVVARQLFLQEEVEPLPTFFQLLSFYPNAMVYFWHHPKAETWIGATPEQLFSLRSGTLTTMALAGTLPYHPDEEYQWGEKEKKEQQWVKDTLLSYLQTLFSKDKVTCSDTFTRRAGNLVHLCSELTVDAEKVNPKELVQKLHPTPAVGGIPLEAGLRFLSENENLDRAYYTGFLGPVFSETQIDLYVNLRCAQMTKKGLLLYVGAGITADSDPQKEWEETQNKAKTLLAAL
jgi:isochorismate synthase